MGNKSKTKNGKRWSKSREPTPPDRRLDYLDHPEQRAPFAVSKATDPAGSGSSVAVVDAPASPEWGLPRKQLDRQTADRFLEAIRNGCGRDLACYKVGIAYRVFKRKFDEDEEFREAVESCERMRLQTLEELGEAMAKTGDNAVLFKFLDRYDKAAIVTRNLPNGPGPQAPSPGEGVDPALELIARLIVERRQLPQLTPQSQTSNGSPTLQSVATTPPNSSTNSG